MKNTNEVSYKELRYSCDPEMFKFETTEELNANYKGIGQQRGIDSLEFGLTVDTKGYNVYLEGPSGSGKTTYTKNYLDKLSKTKKTPPDWCYIYNFENPNEPIAVSLPAGEGTKLKIAMDKFIKEIRTDIKIPLETKILKKRKQLLLKNIKRKEQNYLMT